MTIVNVLQILVIVLAGGTAFAWYQFSLEFRGYCKACSGSKCSSEVKQNPFFSKCFVGALFFTFSFILASIALYLI